MEISFVIPGPPQGKARARTCKNGHTYTPEKTARYEELVRMAYRRLRWYGGNPLSVEICAVYGIPKSFTKAKREQALAGQILPMVTPDVDNIAKIVLDALNKTAYNDDRQVVDMRVSKRYGKLPEVRVTIREAL